MPIVLTTRFIAEFFEKISFNKSELQSPNFSYDIECLNNKNFCCSFTGGKAFGFHPCWRQKRPPTKRPPKIQKRPPKIKKAPQNTKKPPPPYMGGRGFFVFWGAFFILGGLFCILGGLFCRGGFFGATPPP